MKTVYQDPAVIPRRIFCIGRNYSAHNLEMGEAPDSDCVVFMKPVTSLVPPGSGVKLPRSAGEVHHEAELVLALSRGGSCIPVERARGCIGAVALGLDLTLRDLQASLKREGRPWELSKAFDNGAPLGSFTTVDESYDLGSIRFECFVDGELRQQGDVAKMNYTPGRLVEILSRTWNLAPGDIIYTGTPGGVGPINPGNTVTVASPALGSYSWTFV